MKKGFVYMVKWHDTLGIEAWCNWETIVETAKECKQNQISYGVYMGSIHGYAVLVSTINKAEKMLPFANVALIPKGCIKEFKKIK